MERTYTKEDLDKLKAENNKVSYDGKEYDGYEATQMQRRLERTIRKQKRLAKAYKDAGLTEKAQTANIKLRRLNAHYKAFSKAAGLPEQRERTKVYTQDDVLTTSQVKRAGNMGKMTPGEARLIGKVDFGNKQAVISRLEEAEKELSGLDYEVNCSVTSDGKVWWVLGDSSTVDLSCIESGLGDSYSYHNHPAKQTHYSFSAADAAFFINSGEAYSKASDDVYEYTMRRRKETVEKSYEEVYHRFKEIYVEKVMQMEWDGAIEPDVDEYHEIMKILSREMQFDYERKEKS